ncbi:MAG TPA: tetratricopeptide repeat protein [Gemmatimonadales bacterium]|nr:tetratricopeptide repeat protein [Gemmatimonadales bacterium]
MTVGLPGTGIGGLFYLASALAMPLREVYRRVRGRRGLGWRVVAEQTAIAGAILAGMWATGWLLGVAFAATHPVVSPGAGAPSGNVLRTAAVVLTLGTLTVVLLGVELLRLWVHRGTKREASQAVRRTERRVAAGGGRRERPGVLLRGLLLLVVLEAVAAAAPATAVPQQAGASPEAGRLYRADSAFKAGDTRAAAREYAAVLADEPENSRATYRLAQLRRATDPAEALGLFQRYVGLEPSDPWGYMAVADVLASSGRYDDALRWYDEALRLAPGERDAVEGRARVLARARAAAPAITPLVGGSRDSDGNTTFRLGGLAELPAFGPARVGVMVSRERVGDGVTTTHLDHLALRATWQRRAVLKVDATAGATRLDAIGAERPIAVPPGPPGARAAAPVPAALIPTAQLRVRWRAPAAGPALDFRALRSVLDATPLLVANRVVRTEVGGVVELPVAGSFKLRAIGRTAVLSDPAQRNHRTALAGVAALAVASGVELSGQFHEMRYSHPSAAGYFAPRLAQVVEAGSYVEVETARSLLLALDVGVGLRRAAEHGTPVGSWRRALRWYSLLVVPLGAGRDIRLELDGEDSAIANQVATTGQWRYGSAALSLRWPLR